MAGAKARRQDEGMEVRETGWVVQSSGHHSEDFPYYPKTQGMPLKGFQAGKRVEDDQSWVLRKSLRHMFQQEEEQTVESGLKCSYNII